MTMKLDLFVRVWRLWLVPKDNRIDYLNADGEIQFSLARPFPEPINFRSLEQG
jgi:hypothetical protein